MKLACKIGGALLVVAISVMPAMADNYPNRTVSIVVPFPPGGINDIAARILGDELNKKWKQPVIVENRSGGSGIVGTTSVLNAKPDGYTLLMAETAVAIINQFIVPSVPYDFQKSFTPIASVSDTPIVMVANMSAPANNMQEFVTHARKETLSLASPTIGTLNHITGEWIALEQGLKIKQVGYRGGSQAATALASGEVPYALLSYSTAQPYVQNGSAKLLGVSSATRSPLIPDLPTFAEQGIANVTTQQWTALFAPVGISEDLVKKIHSDVNEILADPAVQEKFSKVGTYTAPMSTEQFIENFNKDRMFLGGVIEKAGIGVKKPAL